jgi:hypothetical protein
MKQTQYYNPTEPTINDTALDSAPDIQTDAVSEENIDWRGFNKLMIDLKG